MSQPSTTGESGAMREDTSSMTPTPPSARELQVDTAATDVVSHTMSSNLIDDQLKMQFVVTSQGSWSTDMAPGYVLWHTKVHPGETNMFVRYLSKLYNAWGGGIDYQCLIAGTGFNGGKLLLVKLPPNIDIKKQNIQGLTIFPNTVIDVKAQDSFGVHGSDMRPVNYHYNNQSVGSDMDQYSQLTATGGTVALVVLNKLIAANMGAASVSYTIFTRLGADFVFSQMIPPSVNDRISAVHQPFFNNLKRVSPDFMSGLNLTTMNITTEVYDVTASRNGVVSLDGHQVYEMIKVNLYEYVTKGLKKETDKGVYSVETGFASVNLKYKGTIVVRTGSNNFKFKEIEITTDKTWFRGADHETNTPGSIEALTINYDDGHIDLPTDKLMPGIAPPRGESIVLFGNSKTPDGAGILQPAEVSYRLASKEFEAMDDRLTPVFIIKQENTDNTLGYVRLNREGYFSTSKPTKLVQYEIINTYLEYFGNQSVDQALPKTTPEVLNANFQYRVAQKLALL